MSKDITNKSKGMENLPPVNLSAKLADMRELNMRESNLGLKNHRMVNNTSLKNKYLLKKISLRNWERVNDLEMKVPDEVNRGVSNGGNGSNIDIVPDEPNREIYMDLLIPSNGDESDVDTVPGEEKRSNLQINNEEKRRGDSKIYTVSDEPNRDSSHSWIPFGSDSDFEDLFDEPNRDIYMGLLVPFNGDESDIDTVPGEEKGNNLQINNEEKRRDDSKIYTVSDEPNRDIYIDSSHSSIPFGSDSDFEDLFDERDVYTMVTMESSFVFLKGVLNAVFGTISKPLGKIVENMILSIVDVMLGKCMKVSTQVLCALLYPIIVRQLCLFVAKFAFIYSDNTTMALDVETYIKNIENSFEFMIGQIEFVLERDRLKLKSKLDNTELTYKSFQMAKVHKDILGRINGIHEMFENEIYNLFQGTPFLSEKFVYLLAPEQAVEEFEWLLKYDKRSRMQTYTSQFPDMISPLDINDDFGVLTWNTLGQDILDIKEDWDISIKNANRIFDASRGEALADYMKETQFELLSGPTSMIATALIFIFLRIGF